MWQHKNISQFVEHTQQTYDRNTGKGVKYVQSQQQINQSDFNDIVLVSLFLTWNIFHILSWSFYC